MRDTCRNRAYKCKCGTIRQEYLFDSELDATEFKCLKCDNKLSIRHIKVDKVVSIVSIRTPTKNR